MTRVTAEPQTRGCCTAGAAAVAAGRALPRRRRAGRVPDRDRLRARRRRHQRRGGGAALRGQGPAGVQSADRACRRRRGSARAGAFDRGGGAAGGGVLAGPADAGAAEGGRLPGRRPRHRGARHHRGAGARPSGRARPACGLRQAGGGAVGQPLRPRLADDRAARAGRPARAHRSHRRRRPDAGRRRIDHRRLPRRAGAAAAGRRAARRDRARARADRSPTAPRAAASEDEAPLAPGQLASHYAPRTRAAARCATASQAGEALLAFGTALPAGAERATQVLNLSRARRSRSRPPPTCSRICARSMPSAPPPSP